MLRPRPIHGVATATVAVLLLAACGSRDDTVTCSTCRIERAVAGTFNNPRAEAAVTAAVSPHGTVLLATPRMVLEYDEAGTLLREFDATGDTASELQVLAVLPSDSLLVPDAVAGTIRVFDAAREEQQPVTLPAGAGLRSMHVSRWPRVFFSGHAANRSGLFTAQVEDGFLLVDRHFQPPPAPRWVGAPAYIFAAGDDGGVWAVESASYTISRYTGDGAEVLRVVRSPRWFVKPSRRPGGRIRSSVRGVFADDHDQLWVYSAMATPAAAVAWRSPRARQPAGTVTALREQLYQTVVEVLRDDDLSLIARGSISGYPVAADGLGRLFVVQTAPDGRPATTVHQLRLRRPHP